MAKVNENSEVTIPLKNLLSLIAGTAIAVWVYFGIAERVAFLEHNLAMANEEIKEHDAWITSYEPPLEVMRAVERVRLLEIKIKELEVRLEQK